MRARALGPAPPELSLIFDPVGHFDFLEAHHSPGSHDALLVFLLPTLAVTFSVL